MALAAAIGCSYRYASFDTVGGASVDWLIKGMVVTCGTVDTSTAQTDLVWGSY